MPCRSTLTHTFSMLAEVSGRPPVSFCSVRGETSARAEGAGADLYLSKPVPAEELSASLARLLA